MHVCVVDVLIGDLQRRRVEGVFEGTSSSSPSAASKEPIATACAWIVQPVVSNPSGGSPASWSFTGIVLPRLKMLVLSGLIGCSMPLTPSSTTV